jgi:hypothetical protein
MDDPDGGLDCTSSHLTIYAEVLLGDGSHPPYFTDSDIIAAAGVIENPCDYDLSYTTMSGCLVSSAEVFGPTPWSELPMCDMAVTTHTVPASGWLAAPFLVGTLEAGDYSLRITFNGAGADPYETDFTVEPSIVP